MIKTTRRLVLAALTGAMALAILPPAARADTAADTAMVRAFGTQLVAVVNGPGTLAQKHGQLQPVINAAVDVPGVARFCLGQFWNVATPAQQQRFVGLFHLVLVTSITGHLGDFAGVSFSMTGTEQRGSDAYVGTTVRRPEAPPAEVQWVVSEASGAPRIVDVVAEGTSLRLTQRSDYLSYMSQHGNQVEALLAAIQHQVSSQ